MKTIVKGLQASSKMIDDVAQDNRGRCSLLTEDLAELCYSPFRRAAQLIIYQCQLS